MTKEEAIKWLDKLYMGADITDEYGDMVDMQPYEEAFNMAIKALSQEPCNTCEYSDEIDGSNCYECIKGIRDRYHPQSCKDAISRELVLMEIDKYMCGVPFEKTLDVIIRELPPVTPTRKTGHWIGRKKVGFREWKDVTVLVNLKGCVTDSCECSECGEWLTGSDEYECSARYCPNCGARMVESQEGEK